MSPDRSFFGTVPVDPVSDDLRRRAAIARSIVYGTPVEQPPGSDQSNLSVLVRGILSRKTGGAFPVYTDLPPVPAVDPSQLDEEQRARFNARSVFERGLMTTPNPENIGHLTTELLKLQYPEKQYQATNSGDRAVIWNTTDPTEQIPIEPEFTLSPGSGRFRGTSRVAEQPANVEMDPISRVNAGLKAGTLSPDQARAYIAKLTQLAAPPVIAIPTGEDGAMELVPRQPGAKFSPPGTPISQGDQAKASAAWRQFDAHLRSHPELLAKSPTEAVSDFGMATSFSDPEAIKFLKLDPRFEQLFAEEAPLGAPQGAAPTAAPRPGAQAPSGEPSEIDNAIDAVQRLKVPPEAAADRAGQRLGRTLSPEERQRILEAGMAGGEAVPLPELPPPAAVVTPDQGSPTPGMVQPVETGSARQETLLRQRLATATDPEERAALVQRIRELRAAPGGAAGRR